MRWSENEQCTDDIEDDWVGIDDGWDDVQDDRDAVDTSEMD